MVMKPHRRPFPAIAFSILLAAGVVGFVLTRREEKADPANLPEDLTGTLKAAVAAEQDAELDRFYQQTGYAPVWRQRTPEVLAALKAANTKGLKPEDYMSGETDIALSKGLMRYAYDLRYGRSNPGSYDKSAKVPLGELAWSLAHDPAGLDAALRKLDPPFAEYKRLEAALLKVGPEERPRLEQTMEQWRWLPHSFPRGAILVNVPEFYLRAVDENNNVVLGMRTVVGQIKHQTPLFSADLKYVIFGPYWNVPRSILVNEIVPDIEKDRTYLARNAYEVVNAAGKVVSTGEVSDETLEGLKSGDLRVRQVPGAKNALGRVKFMFPNDNDVYLHDTPSRTLFNREQRTLSHGCVRVENPEALAEWVLRDEPEWSKERIAAALKVAKPEQANLKTAIPVFMLYNTVTVGEDGEVHFLKDVYKREATTAALAPRPRE